MSAPTTTAPRATRPGAPRRGGRLGDVQPPSLTHRPRTGLLLVTPAVLFVLVLVFVPLLAAVGISLTNFPLIGSYRFIGLRNYISALTDPAFGQAIAYTLLYTVIVTGPILVLGYLLAVMIRAMRAPSRERALSVLPRQYRAAHAARRGLHRARRRQSYSRGSRSCPKCR